MKLITQNGQLDLPGDFKMTLERFNPLLSDEGDATVPITLPSSTRNLAAIGHLERIDRAETYINQEDAILQLGPLQKHGKLLIDTVSRGEGIDVSFAIDSGDLYAQSSNKSLKQIFGDLTMAFNTVQEACVYMQDVYQGFQPDADFVVFPVAVSPYEEGEGDESHTVYQYNNEATGDGYLVYDSRMVREGDVAMIVPEGYGVAPFFKLQRLLHHLFNILGYTVEYNCFDEAPFRSQIAIVHNCSDCLVTPVLHYADLVPSCTLGEFMEWLLAKFHVHPVVDSEARKVRIVMMDSVLRDINVSGGGDLDVSGIVEGAWEVHPNPSKRVVLRPTIEIDGTEPASSTLDDLMEKYGGYVECEEKVFKSLSGDSPAVNDCLVLRMATGEFFLLERNVVSGKQELNRLGTNYFTYDRGNSEDAEEFSQADVMPLMLIGDRSNRDVAPFIGERIHRHTSYNGSVDDNEQKIIAVQSHTDRIHFHYPTTGTTQERIPYVTDGHYSFWFGMDNYSLYGEFWYSYNNLILNRPVHLKGKMKYNVAQFIGMDMSVLKHCDGQRLLPVRMSMAIGEKVGLTEAEFILAKNYIDGVADVGYSPLSVPKLKWQKDGFDPNYYTAYNYYANYIHIEGRTEYLAFKAEPCGTSKVWLGIPLQEGDRRAFQTVAVYTIYYKFYYGDSPHDGWEVKELVLLNDPLPANYIFEAVSV